MSAPTPGPWRVQGLRLVVGDVFEVVTDDRDVCSASCGIRNEADARLIAAAPDLLARVQKEASECEHCDGKGMVQGVPGFTDHLEPRPCTWCADIRALIAKATQP